MADTKRFLIVLLCLVAFTTPLSCQQRSDTEIKADVEHRIKSIGVISGEVTVSVQNGSVILRGTVPTLAQKLRIINFARHTLGVRNIVDQLVVVPLIKKSDEEITDEAKAMLRANLANDEAKAISVYTNSGVVTLKGQLKSSYSKHTAVITVSMITGVVDILNELVVRPPQRRTDKEVLDDLSTRYKRTPLFQDSEIEVSVKDSVVTLEGVVNNFTQVELAESIAHFTPGVTEVINNLFVRPSI